MKKIIVPSLIAASMCLTGCAGIIKRIINGGSSSSVPITGEKGAYTVMIYMCGSDLESGYDGNSTDVNNYGLASLDISEILSVSGQPEDVNIIIETGGARAWKNRNINASKLGRFHVENKKLVKDEELTYESMGKTSTFQSFLEWGLSKYPAEKTGVVLWNHGGAMWGVCYDEKKNNDSLTNSEVNTALKNAFKNTGRKEKLEWIGYDACLMQVQDIAYKNSEYFNYMIAAQESEAGEGWEYNSWIDDVYAGKDTETILKAICDGFISSYDRTYGAQGYDNDQTLSFLYLSKMDSYKTAFENLAKKVSLAVGTQKSAFQSMMKNVKEYGTSYYEDPTDGGYSTDPYDDAYYGLYGVEYVSEYGCYVDWGYNYFATFDVYDFLTKLGNKYSALSTEIAAVRSELNELVVYNRIGNEAGQSHGLCLYFPLHQVCQKSKAYTNTETDFSSWRTVVNTLGV